MDEIGLVWGSTGVAHAKFSYPRPWPKSTKRVRGVYYTSICVMDRAPLSKSKIIKWVVVNKEKREGKKKGDRILFPSTVHCYGKCGWSSKRGSRQRLGFPLYFATLSVYSRRSWMK